jgi:hypothetical protein
MKNSVSSFALNDLASIVFGSVMPAIAMTLLL